MTKAIVALNLKLIRKLKIMRKRRINKYKLFIETKSSLKILLERDLLQSFKHQSSKTLRVYIDYQERVEYIDEDIHSEISHQHIQPMNRYKHCLVIMSC